MRLVLRAILEKLKNSKMNGTKIGSKDVWGSDNALLDWDPKFRIFCVIA